VSFDEFLPIPLIGASATGRLGKFVWYVEVLGLAVSINWFNAAVLDTRADVGYAFTDWLSLRAGYRYQFVEGDFAGKIGIELTAHGPYVQLVFEF
jgi:hypothetical protein